MSKILLFVCLALFSSVLGQTQLRLLNGKYAGATVGITTSDFVVGNTTLARGVFGKFDDNPSPSFPESGYLSLPIYDFTLGEIDLHAFDRDYFIEGSIDSTLVSLINVTLEELQSYSLVFVGESEDILQARVSIQDTMFLVEERPNPSPVGKAVVKIVNAAISTYSPATTMDVVLNGTGVPDRLVSLAFGEASEFLEFDTAGTLKLYTSLPVDGGSNERIITLETTIGYTTMVYIRGDIDSPSKLGEKVNDVEFAFPAAPSAPVTVPVAPVAAPTVEPTAPTAPTAPVAAPVSSTPTRAPTKRVSSAATTVAQIAGVAVVMSLLF